MKLRLNLLLSLMLIGSWATAKDMADNLSKGQNNLEEQLKTLDVSNQVPAAANKEKLYAVQARYLPLKNKNEFTLGVASNLTPDGFVETEQMEIGYHFHFNDSWSVAVDQAWVNNSFRSSADNIRTADGAIPDVPFAYSRTDVMAEFNVFYGKFRWSAETVSYFDVYVAAGPGRIVQNTGTTMAYVGDVGFSAWISKWGSARLGLKDYYYEEDYRSGAEMAHNIHAHLDIGYLF